MTSSQKGFAKKDENGIPYIEKNDGTRIYNRKPESWNERDWKVQQFRNDYIFDTGNKYDKYTTSLSTLIYNKGNKAEIAENLYITRDTFEYIFAGH
jgi:hypothetical protein